MPSVSSLPRRFKFLIGSIILLLILISLSSSSRDFASRHAAKHLGIDGANFHPANWLPDKLISPFSSGGNRPEEWDEFGRCLFMSPFDALSNEEKERAEAVELVEVSSGIVRAKEAVFAVQGAESNSTDEAAPAYPPRISQRPSLTNPILGLLRDGERKWQDLVSKQSKTLEHAVQEYKDRWNKNPPKGFDDWWHFAQNNGVLLPDEYDPIMQSLLPFWAFPPADLAKRNLEAENVVETFTLILTKGRVELQWNDDYSRDTWWASRPRADAQINLMEPFIANLPDFRATFTIHDQPSILPSFDRMKELLDLARHGKETTVLDEPDVPEMNWRKACAPDSPTGFGLVENDSPVTFVSSHLSAMDPCQHPSLLEKHGMMLEQKTEKSQPKPHTRILPIMVPSRTTLNADIPITPVGKDGRRDDVGDDPLWHAKSNKLYWRGLATGLQHNKGTGARWRDSHRERLHLLANNMSDTPLSVLTPVGSTGEAKETSYPAKQLSEYYMDVKMSGGPWQCDWSDGSCDEMKETFEFGSKDGPEKSNEFKYVFDTDGNAWSSRFPRLMASRNMVIKASIFPEWNTQTLPEWYAYVPTKMDYSDLYSILAFFRGTPKGKGGHDEVARRIASNGQCWVEKTWRREDMQAYMYRMYLEFARLVSPERDTGNMDFILHARPAPAVGVPDIEA